MSSSRTPESQTASNTDPRATPSVDALSAAEPTRTFGFDTRGSGKDAPVVPELVDGVTSQPVLRNPVRMADVVATLQATSAPWTPRDVDPNNPSKR